MKALALLLVLSCTADSAESKGREALDAHQLAQAETHFRTAISREPEHTGALAGLGWTYLIAGELNAAMGAFEQCTRVAPEDPECLRGRAGVASAAGNPPLARQLLDMALKSDPMHAGTQSSLALLELSQGDVVGAGRRYQGLIDRMPEKAEYRLGLAETELRLDQHEAALRTIDHALALPKVTVRTRAMLHQAQARVLLTATIGRLDPERCTETAPQIRAWVDAAQSAVEAVAATGVGLPDLHLVRRQVKRRQAGIDDICPGVPRP
jgi:tetratricopeptide (TPR) repeat protein